VALESDGPLSEKMELVVGEVFDPCRDKSIGRKLLRFDERGVGPVDGGASEVVGGFAFEWIGGKPFKASVDCTRLSESAGKAAKTSDDAFFSRIRGAVKFVGGESSIEVVGMSTLIKGGPRSAV
jgi:hypothetical protein